MNKFQWLTVAALGVLLVGSIAVGGLDSAFASGNPPAVDQGNQQASTEQAPAYTGSIQVNEPAGDQAGEEEASGDEQRDQVGEHEDSEDGTEDEAEKSDAQFTNLAKITAAEAAASIAKAYPNATFSTPELEVENGFLVYGAEVTQTDGNQLEVKVDAGNGKILSTQTDQEEHEGADGETEADSVE